MLKEIFSKDIIHLALSIEAGGLFMRYPLHQSVRIQARQKTFETYDEGTFKMLSDAYRLHHPAMSGTLCDGQAVGVSVNGAEWEETNGALMDYVYFKEGSLMVGKLQLNTVYFHPFKNWGGFCLL